MKPDMRKKNPNSGYQKYRYFYRQKIGWWTRNKVTRKSMPHLFWCCVGYARSLEDFNAGKMYDDEMMCAPDVKYRKSREWLMDTRPMLLFTIKYHGNPNIVYSFYSKDLGEANEEVARLNEKHGKDTDDGFYLDDSGFDEKWNALAVSFYKQRNIDYEG